MMDKQKLIILTGPTAVGKTALSIKLAQKIGAQIISADSMQIYKYMDIGTAKITPQEMQGIPHYLVDLLEPEDACNVYRFVELAKEAIKDISAKKSIPLVVGGTGFYIRALLYDTDFSETEGTGAYRAELEKMAEEIGNHAMHEMLREIDPVSYETIHENNVKRVIRALEYYHDTNGPISKHNEREHSKESPYDFRYFVLTDDRETIYRNIDRRVALMMEAGLVEEVKGLLKRGCSREMISMQGIGYKQLIPYLEGEYPLERAVELIKRDSRHYAKRQLTWFRREKDVIFLDKRDYDHDDEKILQKMLEYL